jgi:glycosyltransferase involved in cell wall biosynthesis
MKLCMVNGYFHPFIGGSEKHMYELGRRIARTESLYVVTSRLEDTAEYEELENMKVHRLPTKHYKMPMIYPPPMPVTRGLERKLAELDGKHNIDVFNLHGRWFSSYNRVVNYANKNRKLMVLTLHNQRPLGISAPISIAGTFWDKVKGKRVLRDVDRIIAVSAASKKDIMEYGLAGDKIAVIHNGVDTEFYKPSDPLFKNKYKDGFDNLLIFVGRIIEQKGLGHLIEAMPSVLKEHPKTLLLIVGKGKIKNKLKDKVRKMGLSKNVVFPGFIPESQMPGLYSSADIFVLPSLWEVLPIALLEALASGAPLLASDAGGNPEIVVNGKNGYIFEKANTPHLIEKLNEMLSDKASRTEMGKNSRKIALEKFDWEIIKDQTLTFYQSAMEDFYRNG